MTSYVTSNESTKPLTSSTILTLKMISIEVSTGVDSFITKLINPELASMATDSV